MGDRIVINKGIPLFPCPKCGHRNRPSMKLYESMMMYELDSLPKCRNRKCGFQLLKEHFPETYFPPEIRGTLEDVRKKLREIRTETIIECPNPECRLKQRVPTNKGKLRVHCKQCHNPFIYEP